MTVQITPSTDVTTQPVFTPVAVVGPSFDQLSNVDPADYVFSTLENHEFTFNSFAVARGTSSRSSSSPIPVQTTTLSNVSTDTAPIDAK